MIDAKWGRPGARVAALLLTLGTGGGAMAAETPKPPPTRRDDIVDTIHGVKVADPYRWLEDASKPEVQQWMAAEDQQARDYLRQLPDRAALAARLKQLYYLDVLGAPEVRGTRWFYTRRLHDREKAIYYVRDGEKGAERVLIDPNTLTKDGTTSLGETAPSHDGSKLAYILHPNNSDDGVLHVMDVASGKALSDVIPGCDYTGISWTPKGDGFYYTWLPARTGQPSDSERFAAAEVRFHALGSDAKKDVRQHDAPGDARIFVGADISRNGRWLIYTQQMGESHVDVFFRDLHKADDGWHALTHGADATYAVSVDGDTFYVDTNEGAPRHRIFRVDPTHPDRSAWKLIVPERKDTLIERLTLTNHQLALGTLHNAVSGLELRAPDGKLVHDVKLPGLGTIVDAKGYVDQDDLFVAFESFVIPKTLLRVSATSGQVTTVATTDVPAKLDELVTEQVWFPSKDGTRVSMFVVHKKGQARDGKTPYLLQGYGGFNIPMLAQFHPELIAWLEAGNGYALANLRGGGEYGEAWHRAGNREHKQNVFDDFAAAARFLAKQKYTSAEHLAIWGRSNGGLLVGATMTQHPELMRAVLCGVPLLDMVRFHLFGGGKTWTPEYGSPDNDKELRWLYAYSPYHHVKEGVKYPALLMLSADADDRVEPLHARKFVAAVQHAVAGNPAAPPVLLRVEKNSGHAGADLNRQMVDYWADAYAFLIAQIK